MKYLLNHLNNLHPGEDQDEAKKRRMLAHSPY